MLKGFLAKIFSKYIYFKNKDWINNPIKYQNLIFKDLIKKGLNTSFGLDNDFKYIKSYKDFVQKVKVRDYEDIKIYIEKILSRNIYNIKHVKHTIWYNFPRPHKYFQNHDKYFW